MALGSEVRLADGDHVVHFYDADDELMGAIVGYLSGALSDGDAVVMIASAERRAAFEAALRAAGFDIEGARAKGRLFLEDAAEILSRVMVADGPDPGIFDAVVGGLVRAASAGGPVRAYGEMVALLWEAGAVNAAIELEKLWNSLGERTPLSLFCAYAAPSMVGAHAADGFSAVCDLHSGVLGGAPLPDGAERMRRFPNARQSPRLARRFVHETLRGWDLEGLVDDAVLVVAELAANAVLHAESDFTVALSRRADGIRIAVGDSSTAAPTPVLASSAMRLGGRGLAIVDTVVAAWGHLPVDDGKVVWADLGASGSVLEREP